MVFRLVLQFNQCVPQGFLHGGEVGIVGGIGGFEQDVVHRVHGDNVHVDMRGFQADDADADFYARYGLLRRPRHAAGEAHQAVVGIFRHIEEVFMRMFGQADEMPVSKGAGFDIGDELRVFGNGVGRQFAGQHTGENGAHNVSLGGFCA